MHKQKWAYFTYIGKQTSYITNLFKKTDLKIALRNSNTLQKRLMQKHVSPDKYRAQALTNTNAQTVKRNT
jgi:hypothetical protein